MRLRGWRPLNGWRRFADEIVIVVIGVLLALGAGQIVDRLRWSQDTASTRQALNAELARSGGYAVDRIAIEPCLRGRVQELAVKLRAPAGHWQGLGMPAPSLLQLRQSTFPKVYAVPYRYWPTGAWQAALASGGLSHMNQEETERYASLYRHVETMRELQEIENAAAPQLSPLTYDLELSADRREQLLAVLGELEMKHSLMVTTAQEMIALMKGSGLLRDPAALKLVNMWVPIQQKLRGACVRPMEVR